MLTLREKDIDRFWSKVKRGNASECWDYLGAKFAGSEYGAFKLTLSVGVYRQTIASRIAYIVTHGDPGDLFVCHRCDRPICCNPSHLYAGTQSDNEKDKHSRGRAPNRNGEANPVSKLTINDVADIRARLSRGETFRSIGAIHGISSAAVSHIKTGRSWSRVPCSS